MAAARDATPLVSEDMAWRLLLALAHPGDGCDEVREGAGLCLDEWGTLRVLPAGRGWIAASEQSEHGWEALVPIAEPARELFDLYVPLCVGPRSRQLVLAHLGQSLDGRVATVTGASRFVTGPLDLRHMHRLRALFDAVVVGAETARADDPELTTRLCSGPQPTRVVLDPRGRLSHELRVFSDGRAPTVVVRGHGMLPSARPYASHVRSVEAEYSDGLLALEGTLDALRALGCRRIFIEGGGITVSRFLEAGLLDRLQLAIAPKIIGSGTPALSLAPIEHIADAITARCRRFSLGDDMLFDCDLRAGNT